MRKKLKIFLSVIITVGIFSTALAQKNKANFFGLHQVKLMPGLFHQALELDKKYLMEMDADRLLAPYMKAAGLPWHAENYGNWENSGLDGHIGGHYLSALSMMYASTQDRAIGERLNYMIQQLALVQDKNGDGYLGGVPNGKVVWEEVKKGNIRAAHFSLNERWVPLYNIHKMYAGLRDAWQMTGNEKARHMLVQFSDWFYRLTENFTESQFQEILISEHGGLNEVFADVAEITGDDKYLVLAMKMSHQLLLHPLSKGHDPLTGMHANTQIPKIIGFQKIASTAEDPLWHHAALNFWENVACTRSVSIGGNSVREHFHPPDDFSPILSSEQGPETCNSYNMLRLSEKLFMHDPHSRYMDFYEKVMYNHILSSQHPEKGGFVYFTPMRPQHYRVYSQPHENFWCCVGSGMENHARYGQAIYAVTNQTLYVNLFMASELHWEEKKLNLTQRTRFPDSEKSQLQFRLASPQKISLKIRQPHWIAHGKMEIKINGKKINTAAGDDGYIEIRRKWKNNDLTDIELPMVTRLEYLPDDSPWASFVHGPIVLAAKSGTQDLKGLFADDSRMGHVASGAMIPLERTAILKKDINPARLKKESESLIFHVAKDAILPGTGAGEFLLYPFYNVHETRYQLYWPVMEEDMSEHFLKELNSKDEWRLRLEAVTVDQVAAGEQQPEAEHDFKGMACKTGIHQNAFWRSTMDWFSYTLKNNELHGKTLRITYAGPFTGNPFRILINGQPLANETLPFKEDNQWIEKDYNISEFSEEFINIRFESIGGIDTEKIKHVRLVK